MCDSVVLLLITPDSLGARLWFYSFHAYDDVGHIWPNVWRIRANFLPDTLAQLRLFCYFRAVGATRSSSGTTQANDQCCIKCLSGDFYKSWSKVKAFRLATTLSSSLLDLDKISHSVTDISFVVFGKRNGPWNGGGSGEDDDWNSNTPRRDFVPG